jgi:hypothetical protein
MGPHPSKTAGRCRAPQKLLGGFVRAGEDHERRCYSWLSLFVELHLLNAQNIRNSREIKHIRVISQATTERDFKISADFSASALRNFGVLVLANEVLN